MSTHGTTTLTKADLEHFEAVVKKVLRSSQAKKLEPAYINLLEKIVDALNELRLTVEFDHEERLKAIEEFLQNM